MTTKTHFIEFSKNANLTLDDGKARTGCQIEFGTQVKAQVRCYVNFTDDSFFEVADILLDDGSGILRGVPCSAFKFLDSMD
jgi:hypothetical protein